MAAELVEEGGESVPDGGRAEVGVRLRVVDDPEVRAGHVAVLRGESSRALSRRQATAGEPLGRVHSARLKSVPA